MEEINHRGKVEGGIRLGTIFSAEEIDGIGLGRK